MPLDYDDVLASVTYDSFLNMSATTVALCLSAIQEVSWYRTWLRNGESLTSAEWDYIDSLIGVANQELMMSIVGLILPHVTVGFTGWNTLPCDGSLYDKDDYPLLYDKLDPVYIVSATQFRVPDYRDRVMVGDGSNYILDDSGGADTVALSVDELPEHNHTYGQYTFGVDIESVGVPDPTGVGQPTLQQNTGNTGSNQAHENRMPYRAVKFVIVAG